MQERDILVKTIESLNVSIQTLSENHRNEVESLNARIKELTVQVAWLNRQLYGRKSEKLPIIDTNYPDMFAAEFGDLLKQADETTTPVIDHGKRKAASPSRSARQSGSNLPNPS